IRSNMSMSLPVLFSSLAANPFLVVPAIQFLWGLLTSLVSSMEMILWDAGMNSINAFSAVVFPLAVPPQNRLEAPSSIAIQKYAAISVDMDLYSIKSIGGRGISLNFRMVKVEPFVTVRARVA